MASRLIRLHWKIRLKKYCCCQADRYDAPLEYAPHLFGAHIEYVKDYSNCAKLCSSISIRFLRCTYITHLIIISIVDYAYF